MIRASLSSPGFQRSAGSAGDRPDSPAMPMPVPRLDVPAGLAMPRPVSVAGAPRPRPGRARPRRARTRRPLLLLAALCLSLTLAHELIPERPGLWIALALVAGIAPERGAPGIVDDAWNLDVAGSAHAAWPEAAATRSVWHGDADTTAAAMPTPDGTWRLGDRDDGERGVLARAGIRAFNAGDPDRAALHWLRLARTLPPGSPAARDLDRAAREARRRARQLSYGAIHAP